MKKLFSKRLSAHVTEIASYLRYVLNDFFVIALMFFIGGLAFEYSRALRHLNYEMWWLKPLVLILMLLSVQISHFATLVKKPDYVFLLPKESDFYNYLKAAYRYSLMMAVPVQIAFGIILIPLINISRNSYDILGIIIYILMLVLIKLSMMSHDFLNSYHVTKNYLSSKLINRMFIPLLTLSLLVFINYYFALAIILIYNILLAYLTIINKHNSLNWSKIIDVENSRMLNVYKFFNMFTDVPQLTTSVKHRRYLSPMMNIFKNSSGNTFPYLYIRGLLRNNEFSGLYIRLVIIGAILLAFIDNNILNIGLGLLFLYLIIFQLIPFYSHFDSNAFIHIYPIDQNKKLIGFQKVIKLMSTMVVVVFFVASWFGTKSLFYSLSSLILNILLSVFMINIYMPRRIKKS
ncbi:ABC transporter permease [Apilactobacillus xinyiensis]|uniref:ABC transporter permease n=1 Tax=Apilactobacillus xinyiensis TaxID=2841032 RepID=UPI002010A1AF|nr:ABC transporter permease [Apilactobacillus xinyiensis]MCL0329519.1 ABC transporter permease [Apilactobacillus xinyiensis]